VRAPWWVILKPRRLIDSPRSPSAVALWFLFVSTEVFAQVSGSASLLSDYRYRGVSLSRNRPAAQLAVAYDDASGWYGGAFASTVQLVYPATRELQVVSFAGYARRLPSGLSWEAGADYSVVDLYLLVFYQWGGRVGLDMQGNYPAWRRLTDRTAQRPAVQRVLADEKISLP